ncbi:MAG: AraC family transcriptional regulator [Clostridiales bacterium]|jgi:AraC-like DNA-binding protein|nr:AraC family transcriptional regulator [Clostridiales bacterium]
MERKYVQSDNIFEEVLIYACGSSLASRRARLLDFIFYVLIYIKSGERGVIEINGEKFGATAGTLYLVRPNSRVTVVDEREETEYFWVDFGGKKAKPMLEKACIFNNKCVDAAAAGLGGVFAEMSDAGAGGGRFAESRLLACLFEIIYRLSAILSPESGQSGENIYIDKVVNYINNNYAEELNLRKLSEYVGINYQYLSSLFKANVGITMRQYIINLRINNACRLLHNGKLSIAEIAAMVGYCDQLYFAKEFKKKKGITPSLYAKRALIKKA